MPARLFVGLMSGTSVDSVDAALVAIGDSTLELLSTHTAQYPADLRAALLTLKSSPSVHLGEFIALDNRVGHAFANVTLELLDNSNTPASDVAAIGSHGQTIFHQPTGNYPGTLQIGDPSIIAATTGIDVIADFRRADMAAGGQGAPLAPAFHEYMLGHASRKVVINLGGIANITVLGEKVTGFDTGPANSILDEYAQTHLQKPFDSDGQLARSGEIDDKWLNTMLGDPYFALPPPKSTGTDYFNLDWALQHLGGKALAPVDILATLTELTAMAVADNVRNYAADGTEVYICGGGAQNGFLIERLDALLPSTRVQPLDNAGVSGDACEACTFAWLAYRHLQRKTGNLLEVTGADRAVILGGLYPGNHNAGTN